MKQSLFDKVWDRHVVTQGDETNPSVLYIDLHLIHEVTSPQAFALLEERGLEVRRPDRTLATIDHSTPTRKDADGNWLYVSDQAKHQVNTLLENTTQHGIKTHGWNSDNRGIIHVMGPEVGATQPGMTIVCGDSHTSTHGAFGALAFGIGTTQVGHVLANQSLLMRKPKSMLIHIKGDVADDVTPKDVILAIIAKIGVGGGTGHVLEYKGECFDAMDMEGRMTVCNMSIEAGARAGMIAPDQKTCDFFEGREQAPSGDDFKTACADWLSLRSDAGCSYDNVVEMNGADIRPMVTYGTHPGMAMPLDGIIPKAADEAEQSALEYMQVKAGSPITGVKVDMVFIGSCTNSRLPDLRAAAAVFKGQIVADHVEAVIVPGSVILKKQAEAEGLDQIFIDAGAQWREPGCSMCIGMNGDIGKAGQLIVSTSNRNFAGRQGPGVRTILASPQTAAASAIAGMVAKAVGEAA